MFELYVNVVCASLQQSIKRDRRHYLAMYLFGAGWYRDYKEHVQLLKLLQAKGANLEVAARKYRLTIWIFASESIFGRNFSNYVCPECDRRYAPSEGSILEWTLGEGLAAQGGRRFECPEGHTVYAIGEWNS